MADEKKKDGSMEWSNIQADPETPEELDSHIIYESKRSLQARAKNAEYARTAENW